MKKNNINAIETGKTTVKSDSNVKHNTTGESNISENNGNFGNTASDVFSDKIFDTDSNKDLNLDMFKDYDIRTKIEKLSETLIERLCNSVALYYRDILKVKSVVICRDARLYVPHISQVLCRVLNEAGLDVFLNPLPVSTCQFYFTCMQYRESGGLMITASHNPRNYVGIKLVAPDLFALAMNNGPEGGIAKIKEFYEQNAVLKQCAKQGKCIIINELDHYIDYSMKLSGVKQGSLKGLKVLFEFLSGSAGTEVALAFQKAGADITVRNVLPDGFFLSGDPNPVVEGSIKNARKAMKDGNYNLGFCFDGDGDRLDLMDSDGQQIVPGLNMSIIIKKIMDIYKGEKKNFYADVKAMPVSLCEIAKSGANVHIVRNGHSFIKAGLKKNCSAGYFAAEEESAHYYINLPYNENDFSKGFAAVESTLFFALLTARCYLENPQLYKNVRKIQDSIFRVKEWPLYCEKAPQKMPLILEEVEERMKKLGATVIKTMEDGSDLDAVLMRFNLPQTFDAQTTLNNSIWVQVAQRISRSDDAMAKWEVVSNSREKCEELNNEVLKIVKKYVDAGWAEIGEE